MAKETRTLPEKFALRLPEGWLEKLGASAEANRRSTNAEIIARLERSFAEEDESWLERLQKSPTMKLEKQMIAMEARLEDRIDNLRDDLAGLWQTLKERGIL